MKSLVLYSELELNSIACFDEEMTLGYSVHGQRVGTDGWRVLTEERGDLFNWGMSRTRYTGILSVTQLPTPMQISAAACSPDAGGGLMLCKLRRRARSAPWLWQGDRCNFADSIDLVRADAILI